MINPSSLVGSDPSVISTLLIPLFEKFDEEGVCWAVMRGWEGLPYYTRHDVDFLIAKKDIRRAVKLAGLVAREQGWVQYGSFKFSNLRSHWFLLDGENEVSFLQLDFFTEASLRGIPFLDSRDWLANRMRNSVGIWHTAIGYAACCTLLKELIANGRLEGELRYQQIKEAVSSDIENYRQALSQALSSDDLVDQIIHISKTEEWLKFNEIASSIRESVLRFKLSNILPVCQYVLDVIRMQFFPYLRLFIAFIGPDGCGKTTVADAVVKRFDHRPFAGLYRIHSDFGCLPRLRDIYVCVCRLLGKKIDYPPEPLPGTKHMGMKPPLSRMRSMFYVFYYGLGLFLGQFKLLFWRSFSGIVLADRYYFDYYYMRGHMKCPRWYLNLVSCIVPKPDLVFVLERPADDIYRQKPELTVNEISRQQNEIRNCVFGKKYTRVIDASEGIDLAVQRVSREIELWLIERDKKIEKK